MGQFSANDKLPFAVNSLTLPVCPYLGLKICGWLPVTAMFVFIHPLCSILAEKQSSKLSFFYNKIWQSISKRVLKSCTLSQTWDCDVWGYKKPCGKSLTSGAWSRCTKHEPQTANLMARFWSRDFLAFALHGKSRKTSVLRSLMMT